MHNQKSMTRYIAVMAMFVAVSFVAVLLGKVIPNVAGMLSYEPKDALIVIAGFIFGPISCLIVSVLTSLIEMLTISGTGLYGLLMNIVSSCAFALPAAWIYSRRRTQKAAVLGLFVGMLTVTATMLAWNYIITPNYLVMIGTLPNVETARETVTGMLATVFLPFNLIKSGINATLAFLLYKPVVSALRSARLVAQPSDEGKSKFRLGLTLAAAAALVTFVLLLLVMLGVL